MNGRGKRLLSIDGGGLCGLIPAGCLIRMESQLNQLTGTQLPLGKRFDLIGGTSTGAILAAGLSLGLPATQLRDFYLQYGKEIFTKVFLTRQLWHKYSSGPLENRLKQVFGEATTLGSPSLLTKLMVVTKNVTQGSTWFFTNNPNSRFFKNNKHLPLWQIVRASTAAPTYFPPQSITVPDNQGRAQQYEFVDGGVSSFNNPALQLFLEATEPSYDFGWPTGVDKLLLISLGTGYNAVTVPSGKTDGYTLLNWAGYLIKGLMNDMNLQQNLMMQLIGQRPTTATRSAAGEMLSAGVQVGAPSESVVNRMSECLGATKLLTYQRMTVSLTRQRLNALGLGDIDPAKVREMDAADQIDNMRRVGEKVAEEQVHMDLVRNFFV